MTTILLNVHLCPDCRKEMTTKEEILLGDRFYSFICKEHGEFKLIHAAVLEQYRKEHEDLMRKDGHKIRV